MEKCKETFKEVPEDIFNLNETSTNRRNESEVIGGIFSDSKTAWLALGPFLQVFYIDNGQLRSIWCFGTLAKEENARITCIEEVKLPLVAVGLKYGLKGGMVCIYNTSCARVMRAIEVPEEVTSLQVVSNGFDAALFPGSLAAFDGILAVGTSGGAVFIMDLGAESLKETRRIAKSNEIHYELNPCQMQVLATADVVDLERHKTQADIEDQQLAILLNERETRGQHFELKTPNGRNVIFAAKEEVTVSRLHYGPQLCSLIVGYNFGALQIWDLITMRLVFTSPVYEEKIPVSYIAIQEPIDDPRAYCYFWAMYSCAGQGHNSFPMAALYSLSYESKEYHEGYGHLYQNLQCCAVRFQVNLQMMASIECKSSLAADCVRVQAFHKGLNSPNSSPDEYYTLSMVAWNVACEEHKVHTYLTLFDLNQWYKEEMPGAPHQGQYQNYMTTLSITQITTLQTLLLDVAIKPESIHSFVGVQNVDEHYRPSSLSYNVCAMSSIETCRFTHLGVQKQFFRNLDDAGPLALMHPDHLYETIMSTGLSPLFLDPAAITSATAQRETLLSTALERRKLQWLCKCAISWGNGSHRSAGLSLEFLLNWGWERTRVLKQNADRLCTSLFDYSGDELDENVGALLISCRGQFATLRDLYRFIMKHCVTFLVHPEITGQQLDWLQRNYEYFNVIGWMINLTLLPESKENYPFEGMQEHYTQRRKCLQSLEGVNAKCGHYLLIDHLTDDLKEEWASDGSPEYPPATMQSLLRCYFNRNMDTKRAHVIVAYTLLNLQRDNEANIAAAIIKFPQIFDLTMSETKVVQSFWQFDHGQIEPAVKQLANTLIRFQDIGEEQHRNIIAILKLQRQYGLALMYLKSRYVKGCKEDIKSTIELHVRNNMLFEAVCIARRYGDCSLLETFFIECLKADVFMNIVSINFTKEEEEMLLQYMLAYNFPKREDFKAMYYVRRGRYLDFYLNHDKSTPRNAISNMVRNCLDGMLPRVTRKIISTCMDLRNFEYNEQKPLSAFVCDPQERAKFGNDVLKATIVNCKPVWTRNKFISEDDFPLMRPPFPKPRSEVKNVAFPRRVSHLVRPTPEVDIAIEQSSKRRRLSDPRSASELNMTTIQTLHVSRNESICPGNVPAAMTPHSILKTPSTYSGKTKSITPDAELRGRPKSMTPTLSRRPAIGMSNVRFAGISSNSASPLSSPPISISDHLDNELQVENSSLSGYQSAQQSPDSPSSKRKRSVSEAEEEKHISILRSESFNYAKPESARRLFEPIRGTSFAAELLPAALDETSEPRNVSIGIPEVQKPAVFVFTGRDELELPTNLRPKARATYQKTNRSNVTKRVRERESISKEIAKQRRDEAISKQKEHVEAEPSWRVESTLDDDVFISESSRVVTKTQPDKMEVDSNSSQDGEEINPPLDSKSITISSTSYKTASDGTSKFSNEESIKVISHEDKLADHFSMNEPRTIYKLNKSPLMSTERNNIVKSSSPVEDTEKIVKETKKTLLPKQDELMNETTKTVELASEAGLDVDTTLVEITDKRGHCSHYESGSPHSVLHRSNWVDYFANSPANLKVNDSSDEKSIKKFVTSYVYGGSPSETDLSAEDTAGVKPGPFDVTRKSIFEKSSYINYFTDPVAEDSTDTDDGNENVQVANKVPTPEVAKHKGIDTYENLSNISKDNSTTSQQEEVAANEVRNDNWIRTIHHNDALSESRCVSTVQPSADDRTDISERPESKDSPVEVIVIHSPTTSDDSAKSGSKTGSSTNILEMGFIAECESDSQSKPNSSLSDTEMSENTMNESIYLPALSTISEEPETPSRRTRSSSALSSTDTPRRRSLRLLQCSSALSATDSPKPEAVSRTRRGSSEAQTMPMKRTIRTRSVDAIEDIKKCVPKSRKSQLPEEREVAEVKKCAPIRRRAKSVNPESEMDLLTERRMTRHQLKLMKSNESLLDYSSPSFRNKEVVTVLEDVSISSSSSTTESHPKKGRGKPRKVKTVDEETRRISTRHNSLRSNMSTISEEVDAEPRRITRSRRSSATN